MKLPTYFALILLSTAVMASIASAYQGEQLFRQNHRMYDRLSPGGHSIITTKGNLTYMVYADLSRNIRVVKYNHNTDAAETKNLVTNGYQTLLDGHHYFAIGVDRDGYIHVVGDMHHYPFKLTSHVKAPYRPQDNGGNNTVLYWKSRSPHNINQFDFLGANTSKRIKGKGFTYYNFTNDRNGRL
ncbi:MAG: BNR-4 repeat-containing protein, partial [Verrucomicrobiota bacterium]